MKKAAFTLIELLVVICIIAILAGIALPVYNKVLERSHATTDAANLKQIGLGIAAYLNDNDDQMFSTKQSSDGKYWPEALQAKYVTDWKIFKSPFDKRPDPTDFNTLSKIPVSYGVNTNVLNQSTKPDWDGNFSRLTAPSLLVLFAPEVTDNDVLTFTGFAGNAVSLDVPPNASDRKKFRGTHNSRSQINALFADTHVSPLRYGPSTDTDAYSNTTDDTGNQRWKPLATATNNNTQQ